MKIVIGKNYPTLSGRPEAFMILPHESEGIKNAKPEFVDKVRIKAESSVMTTGHYAQLTDFGCNLAAVGERVWTETADELCVKPAYFNIYGGRFESRDGMAGPIPVGHEILLTKDGIFAAK